jgi:hypothetical protein
VQKLLSESLGIPLPAEGEEDGWRMVRI